MGEVLEIEDRQNEEKFCSKIIMMTVKVFCLKDDV